MRPRISVSKTLAIVALVSWGASLFLPGLIVDHGMSYPTKQYGWDILASGWLGVLSGTFAWFANPFFMLALLLISFGKTPAFLPSVLAILLAYSTFFLDGYAGGGKSDIYAYGYGFGLWIYAMHLSLLASCAKSVELKQSGRTIKSYLTKPSIIISTILLLASIITFVHLEIEDRSGASKREIDYLEYAMFKRGVTCKEFIKKPLHILDLDGPLEIVDEAPQFREAYLMNDPRQLLKLGIPIIRKNNIDFFFSKNGDIMAMPASGDPSARLLLKNANKGLTAVLSSQDNTVGFEQTWVRTDYTCPDIRHPKTKTPNQAEELIKASLRIIDTEIPKTSPIAVNKYFATRRLEKSDIQAIVSSVEKHDSYEYPDKYTPCPVDIRILGDREKWPNKSYGRVFKFDKLYYFMESVGVLSASCNTKSIYIYQYQRDNFGNIFLKMLKSGISEFSPEPVGTIHLDYDPLNHDLYKNTSRVFGIIQNNNSLTFKIFESDKNNILTFRAKL